MLTTAATFSRTSKANVLVRPLVATSSRMYSSVLSTPLHYKESTTTIHHPQTMPLTDTTVYTAQGSTHHDEDASFSPVVNTVFDD
ncbi:hypothetical protein K492DRAFT_176854 [Lichtheimia hyalospora FSU 10163]|nr:hypothetical protein K492DRAFT_176854 [Lichtheimia hyalospora FSU 10163]